VFGPAIDDVCELEAAGGVRRGQTARDGRADRAESEERDSAAGMRCGWNDVKRIQAHSSSSSPRAIPEGIGT
jgi:hypothetical protein